MNVKFEIKAESAFAHDKHPCRGYAVPCVAELLAGRVIASAPADKPSSAYVHTTTTTTLE